VGKTIGTDLILASGSPRRKRLLESARVSFETAESGATEEPTPGEEARSFAKRMAAEKALAVSTHQPAKLVLAADTVVELNGEILGKPKNAEQAHRMLRALSGKSHSVFTAFALARHGAILEDEIVVSRVTFRPLSETEIETYVASGEPFDKAGGYGIQGRGGSFIVGLEGSLENVMGLPLREVLTALRRNAVECSERGNNP
jgi:septum formation protein